MLIPENIQNKNVLLRADLDLPLKDGRVENNFRLLASLPTIKFCLQYAKKTIIIGHLGRPDGLDPKFSLAPVQEELKRLLNQDVPLVPSGISPGERWTGESPLYLMENLRFDVREDQSEKGLAEELALGAEVYVYEAFATYRPCASLSQIPEILPTYTGFRFDEEVEIFNKLLGNPPRPTLLLASGAKQDKLEIVKKLTPIFDKVLLGGAFASKTERTPDGYDINDSTIALFLNTISEAKTIVLNGPVGKYEDGYIKGTKAVFQAVADSHAYTVVGGGDTLAAIPHLGFSYTLFSFVSTGGGAMLEYLTTNTHPLLEILKNAKLI